MTRRARPECAAVLGGRHSPDPVQRGRDSLSQVRMLEAVTGDGFFPREVSCWPVLTGSDMLDARAMRLALTAVRSANGLYGVCGCHYEEGIMAANVCVGAGHLAEGSLPGPSRTITVEPVREPDVAPPVAPSQPVPVESPVPDPAREPVPAR